MAHMKDVKSGSVIQINEQHPDRRLTGSFVYVTEVKNFGIEGYMPRVGINGAERITTRIEWKHMDYIGEAVTHPRGLKEPTETKKEAEQPIYKARSF